MDSQLQAAFVYTMPAMGVISQAVYVHGTCSLNQRCNGHVHRGLPMAIILVTRVKHVYTYIYIYIHYTYACSHEVRRGTCTLIMFIHLVTCIHVTLSVCQPLPDSPCMYPLNVCGGV